MTFRAIAIMTFRRVEAERPLHLLRHSSSLRQLQVGLGRSASLSSSWASSIRRTPTPWRLKEGHYHRYRKHQSSRHKTGNPLFGPVRLSPTEISGLIIRPVSFQRRFLLFFEHKSIRYDVNTLKKADVYFLAAFVRFSAAAVMRSLYSLASLYFALLP